ncbi:hypothetical protein YC79_003507 [Salmonella enterica subsp. enterica]|uniref:Uncharacterized protein n=1 Tax=Salmonella sp. 14 TaxID=1179812 RepID=I3W346_9ENTR|nr:hypothetical protein [Salmonella sp. 14]AFK90023.1 hypothetical protein [Salmonella sp. 14]EDS5478523.1 hypothetical protein [Salmonella enterica subsp. enterica]EDZ5420566.1 hypothetical protein [Salmonella enterica subsp. enterica serovar Muenchen]
MEKCEEQNNKEAVEGFEGQWNEKRKRTLSVTNGAKLGLPQLGWRNIDETF